MRRGPLLMILAGLCFAVMTAGAKVAREELSGLEVVFWRSAPSMLLAWGLARWNRGVGVKNARLVALRALLGLGAIIAYFSAVKGLSLANMALIMKTQPLLVAALAPLLFGISERINALEAGLVALGLLGCAVLLAPGLGQGFSFGLLALTSAVLTALAHLCLRALRETDSAEAIVFWFQATTTAVSLPLLLLTGTLSAPSAHLWPWLIAVGLSGTAGQWLLTRAYAEDRAAVVAAAGYVEPLWAALVDVALFSVVPGGALLLGGALVVAAGLGLVLLGERAAR